MQSQEIRKRFLAFFKERGHVVVPSSSLIPDDPSVLLTTAGMQQFKPYFIGKADPVEDFGSKNTTSIQKSFRTSDIEEVGDESHLTFFEMLGNFSFGGYFKKEAIERAHEFLTKELGLPISFVTIFEGSAMVEKDKESRTIWKSLGIEDIREEGIEDNFWGPTGHEGPCGPTTEIYCANAAGGKAEVWNIVFNEFFFPGSREELLSGIAGKKLEKLKIPGVDTGMGLERIAMIAQNVPTIFETDLFSTLMESLPKKLNERTRRIIADHIRGSVFLLADGVRPSNKEAGYILRRLLRRALVYEYKEHLPPEICENILRATIGEYSAFYPELEKEKSAIISAYETERQRFQKTLRSGLKKLEKAQRLSGKDAFDFYQSYGLPPEVTYELKPFDWGEFTKAKTEHGAASAKGQERKFGGHGLLLHTGELKAADEKELKTVTRLHTATHLLHAGLRQVLGPEATQMGSDITAERTRFDFSFPRKVTPEELKRVEDTVNNIIRENYYVVRETMPFKEAIERGALHFFKEKYPKDVTVYSVVHPETGNVFSRELCGGPHVKETGEIGQLSIIKEEASSAGVRRIRATVVE